MSSGGGAEPRAWMVRGRTDGGVTYEDLWLGTFGLFVKESNRLYRPLTTQEAMVARDNNDEIFTLVVINHTLSTLVGLFRDEAHLLDFVRRNMGGSIECFEF